MRERHAADAHRRREHGLHLRRRQGARTGTRPSTSRSSATAPSTTTAGWPAPSTAPRGKPSRGTPLENDMWELYDTRTDFSPANDLAAKNPEKLKELQDLFLKEAVKYHVLPLDDRLLERLNAALVGRPDLMAGRTSLTVYEGMIGMSENVFINTEEPVAHDHRRGGDPEERRQRRDPRPGRALRRLEPVPEGRQADVHLQLPRPAALHGRRHARRCPPARRRSASSSPTTAAASARAARARSSSTARRSPRDGSTAPSAASSRPTKAPTSARTRGRR